ncbi:DUF6531 domain-containing protein [Clostridium sp. Marseille-P2415]|uniref:DUF6531 domain-containing protein n=1 Tax=Clostridium sp. Marseille-P2415 TaxID=1805471 RepID=UPI001F222E2B|nr:DUF6531 domain-containing protein [Clostridium sp. Marseille-P2415]
MNTGNYIYEKEDLVIKGTMPLSFKLFYNAMECGNQGNLGEGWSHNYGVRLIKIKEEELLGIVLEDGRELPYCRKLGGEYAPVMGDGGSLKKSGNVYFYEQEDGTVYEFDCDGRLCTQRDKNGNRRIFTYNEDGFLESVGNGTGGQLNYTYNKEKNLIYVEDHTGRKVSLRYQYGKLRWFINSSGCTYTYDYNENGKLNGVVTPRNIAGVRNKYDGADRVWKQTMPDGGVVELRYDDKNNRTYMKEQNGNMIIYECDERLRNIRTIYEDGEETFEYNDRNQLTRHVDKNGNMIKLAYDDKGNLSQIIYPDGCKHNMTYDANNRLLVLSINGVMKIKNTYDNKGNLLHMEDALGREQKFIYDTQGRVKEIVQTDKSHIYLEYDEHSNISKIMDGSKNTTSYAYDALNRVVKTVDGNGNRTSYEYDTGDRITGVINAQGKRRIYEYTKSGKVTKVIDFNGAVTCLEYNNMNQVSSVITPDGGKEILEYDQMQNVAKRITPNGAEYLYKYNSLNRLEKSTLPTGGSIYYEYDTNGNRTVMTDVNGNKTTMEYDERNRVTEVVDAGGARTVYDYDMEGNLISITNSMGQSIAYTYDEAGQKISETDILGNVIRYEYNDLGKISCVIDSKQRKIFYEYGTGGVLEKTVYPDGSYEQYSYDKNGNLLRRENQKGDYLEYTYDCLDKLVNVKSSLGQKVCYTYDAVGNVTSVTDTLGNVTKYEYSMGGNLIAVIDAMGNKTEYGYDAMDNLIIICQHEGRDTLLKYGDLHINNKDYNSNKVHLTRYERNVLGMIETITDPMGLMEHYTYNQAGQMIVKLDKEGYETRYNYTKTGELSEIIYADNRSVCFQYNALKHLIEVKDWLGTTKVELDEAGRTRKITDYKGREIGYEWSKIGERTGIVYPDGRKVSYEYDELSRLSRLIYEGEDITYHYDKEGRLMEKRFLNGIITNYQYNSLGLLSCLTHKADGDILERYDYEYDLAGNKTEIIKQRKIPLSSKHLSEEICKNLKEENGIYSYRYDKLDRLIEVYKDTKRLRSYNYDAFGNRIRKLESGGTEIYKYNTANQLLEINGMRKTEKYKYDNRGNLIEILLEGKPVNGYEFDTTNCLSKAVNADGQMALYKYCGLGYRIEKKIYTKEQSANCIGIWGNTDYQKEDTTAQIDYLIDLTKPYHNLLAKTETTEQDMNMQEYIWDFNVASMKEGRDSYIYLQDELGSPIRLLDMQKRNRTVYGYDEFGKDLYGNHGNMQPFGYTGYQKDGVAKAYFAQAREYMPWIGRFGGKDKVKGNIKLPITLNEYLYCWGNSLKWVDMDGKTPIRSEDLMNWYIERQLQAADKVWREGWENFFDTYDSLVDMNAEAGVGLGGAVTVGPAKIGLVAKGYVDVDEKLEPKVKVKAGAEGDIIKNMKASFGLKIDDVLAGEDIKSEVGISNFSYDGGLSWTFGVELYDVYGGGVSVTVHLDKLAEALGVIPKDIQCNQIQ